MSGKKKGRPVCPNCGAMNSYYRKWTDSFCCRTCGHQYRWHTRSLHRVRPRGKRG